MKSLFFGKTKQLSRSVERDAPGGIMIMMMAICVLVLIVLSGSILENRHFDRYSGDVIAASRLAEEIAAIEAGKIDDVGVHRVVTGQDGMTEFLVEKRMIPGPPGGRPRIMVIVKWKARGEEKQVYLTRVLDTDILTAAHLP
ncbi:MAG: hypothetical protein KAV42_10650 [Candidatus Krumholzibacteria bacterium]|nr:hypothetical protein [Candidatus Krumholzibacteria bacterium]